MPTPSWTVSFTMPTASNSPAKACAGHEANRTRRLDQPPSPVTQIHRPAKLATRAASFRYGGRHHSGIPGDIIPLYPGDFIGIRRARRGETCQRLVACPMRAGHATSNHTESGRKRRAPHEKTSFSALVIVTAIAAASGAQAQDAAAGKTSFNKCLACHAIGEGAKNKVGPELNGLDGRKSGTRRIIHIRMPTRIPASPGTRPYSRNTSRTRRRRFPAPRWHSPASRTRKRSTISGPTSRNTTRTARRSNAPAVGRVFRPNSLRVRAPAIGRSLGSADGRAPHPFGFCR